MAKHKIGVISDTHNKLRKEVLEHLSGCELILHAGDICKPEMIRDFNRGKSVRQVARRHGISEELADQVCRMVVTHPGIGPDGVMKRLGI